MLIDWIQRGLQSVNGAVVVLALGSWRTAAAAVALGSLLAGQRSSLLPGALGEEPGGARSCPVCSFSPGSVVVGSSQGSRAPDTGFLSPLTGGADVRPQAAPGDTRGPAWPAGLRSGASSSSTSCSHPAWS